MQWFKDLFTLDLRSLAVLRIGLGSIIIYDLITRFSDLAAHYTDVGVLPRDAVIFTGGPWALSIHMMSGLWYIQVFLFLLAGIVALMLLAGYKTRFAIIVSWLMFVSIDNRNVWVESGADQFLRLLLFWGMFLPLGAMYSVDSLKYPIGTLPTKKIVNFATAGYLLQVALVYFTTVIFKHHAEWTKEGSSVYYALNLWVFWTPFGQLLLQLPFQLLRLLTFSTYYFEAAIPYLLFFPFFNGPIRTLTALFGMFMHVNFGLGLDLGIFSHVAIIAYVGLLPYWFWEKITRLLEKRKSPAITLYFDDDCNFCTKAVRVFKTFLLLRSATILASHTKPAIAREMEEKHSWIIEDKKKHFYQVDGLIKLLKTSYIFWIFIPVIRFAPIYSLGNSIYTRIALHRKRLCVINPYAPSYPRLTLPRFFNALAALALLFIIYWNISTLLGPKRFTAPEFLSRIGYLLRLDQKWNMFAPSPPKYDMWLVIPGKLQNGKTVDIFQNGAPVTYASAFALRKPHPDTRWGKYLSNLMMFRLLSYDSYARYLCRSWNTSHAGDQRLLSFDIYHMSQKVLLNSKRENPIKTKILTWQCFAPTNTPKGNK